LTAAFSLPNYLRAILRKRRILGRQSHSFGPRLGYQYAIEWVLVKLGQARQPADVSCADGEHRIRARATYFSHHSSGSTTSAPRLRDLRTSFQRSTILAVNGEPASATRAASPSTSGVDAPKPTYGYQSGPSHRPSIQSSASASLMGYHHSSPAVTSGSKRAMPNGKPDLRPAGINLAVALTA
jgi:hypothetical protein